MELVFRLLCLLVIISIVVFGVTVVELIKLEVKEYRTKKIKDQKECANE